MPRSPGRIKLVRPSTILGIPASSGTPMLGAAGPCILENLVAMAILSTALKSVRVLVVNTSRSCRQAFARFCELNIELILSNARGYSYNAYGRVEGL